MRIEIRREDSRLLSSYASIPNSFEIREVVDLTNVRIGSRTVSTRMLEDARLKNYDTIPGNEPQGWPARFNVDSWIVLAGYDGAARIGGVIVIADARELATLGEPVDLAVLWDLRVAKERRGNGVGRALVAAAEIHAQGAGCRGILAETQDANVPACRLYAGRGFVLESIVDHAYPDVPTETKLIWTKRFGESRSPGAPPSQVT